MAKISAYIIAFNEAAKIEAAVGSVLWADEIVVADSSSTDGTAMLAAALGARVVQIPFNGFGELRNRAIDECRHEWIFSLDSDERCTAAVRDEILEIVAASGQPHDAYLVPRRSYMMGRWIKGSGWYPNYRQPQLYRKGEMRYTGIIHEVPVMQHGQSIGKLENAIVQFPFRNFEEILHKANRYSTVGARKLAHRRVSMWTALGHATWAFIKHYIFKVGFRDGWAGFVIAFGNFEGTFYRYAKRYEEIQDWKPLKTEPLPRPAREGTP